MTNPNLEKPTTSLQELFRTLPKVDEVLLSPRIKEALETIPRSVLLEATRSVIDELRSAIATGQRQVAVSADEVVLWALAKADKMIEPSLKKVINATGIIVHTNLGRSILAQEAVDAVVEAAANYSTLEYSVEAGERGSRHTHIEDLLCELTGAEAALAVNNNAAAVMMCISAFSKGKEALVSRGQLVEIGGSFRVPDIMAESGAKMVEVGTTNKTHLRDYESALNSSTGLLLKVHSSNYRVLGFTAEVSLEELVELGAKHDIPVMEDQGSGVLIDLSQYGLPHEPMVGESVKAGATVVTFSGDKLLGGPQAGLIVGKASAIAMLKKHPLARALRLDKMTLAALEATLKLYRDEKVAIEKIPTLKALTMRALDSQRLAQDFAEKFLQALEAAGQSDKITLEVRHDIARAGGGALPLADIPTYVAAIQIKNMAPSTVERLLRSDSPVPIIVRISDDCILIDPRTLVKGDDDIIIEQFLRILNRC